MESEKSIEQYLVRKVRKSGGRAYKFVSPGNPGVPDRLIVFPDGRIVFAELKREEGRLSAVQKNQIKTLLSLGQIVKIVYSREDADKLVLEHGGVS